MRVLYVTGKAPLPANSGDALRNVELMRAVREGASKLDLLTLPQRPGPGAVEGLVQLRELCDEVTVGVDVPSTYLGSKVNLARTLAGRPYYRAVGSDPAVRELVAARLRAERYDVIVLSQLFLASALPVSALARTVYDTHNVHHLRLGESLATKLRWAPPLRALVMRQVRRDEAAVIRRAAATVACSELDAAAFRAMAPAARLEVVPNGVELPSTPRRPAPPGAHLLFLASLDYVANVEGLAHLVDHIVPHLRPGVVVDVAGSNGGPAVDAIIARGGDRVRYLGYVADAAATMRGSAALLVPLRTGGGTRLKVLEAFAHGVPVVTTTKGVEGLPVVAGRDAFVADDPADFAASAHRVLDDPEQGAAIAANARALVTGRFEWAVLGKRFARLVEDVGR